MKTETDGKRIGASLHDGEGENASRRVVCDEQTPHVRSEPVIGDLNPGFSEYSKNLLDRSGEYMNGGVRLLSFVRK